MRAVHRTTSQDGSAASRPASSAAAVAFGIAATATAVDVPLVTLNRRHFEPLAVHGLTLLSNDNARLRGFPEPVSNSQSR
jgi:hypothetical protein